MNSIRRILATLLRYWLRHKLQCLICVLGIALGVAVVTAMDIANSSALQSFRESLNSVSGRATHQIAPREGLEAEGIPEEIYAKLLRENPGFISAAPVIESYAQLLARPDVELANSPLEAAQKSESEIVRVLGIDPLVDADFRPISNENTQLSGGALSDWLARDDACVLSANVARRFGLKPGDPVAVLFSGVRHKLKLIGTYEAEDRLARASDDVMLMDIGAAQERFGTLGRINAIDLILPAGGAKDAVAEKIRALLPETAVLQRPAERAGRTEALLNAFQLNLRALSLLALVVGVFLIHNTLTVAVLQRLPAIGTLRCLGASAAEIRAAVLLEALLLGAIGSTFGLLAGTALAGLFLEGVGATINDLYAHLGATAIFFDGGALAKGFALGVFASLAGAFFPAREAGSVSPTHVLRRSRAEFRARSGYKTLAALGAGCFAAALALALFPGKSPVPGLIAAFALSLGGALCSPAITRVFSRLVKAGVAKVAGVPGAMAARGMSANLSRTGLAVGALGIALSMTIGVALMVSSFRSTLDRWMDQSLHADLYIRPAGPSLLRHRVFLDSGTLDALRSNPAVEALDTYRGRDVTLADGSLISIAATDTRVTFSRGRSRYPFFEGDAESAFASLLNGSVIISESLARKQDLRVGGTVSLPTTSGPRELQITGIYYEYATDRGVVTMDVSTFEKLFGESRPNSASVYLRQAADVGSVRQKLRSELGSQRGLYIFSNRSLRDEALRIFDRTFAITGQLEKLSLTVGLCGILSALLALLRERSTEFALLRALGMASAELFTLILLEGLLLGAAAFLVACAMGPLLSLLLIHVINVRAFGWTIFFAWDASVFLRAGVLALLMAALAAIYPALRAQRLNIAGALREE